MADNDILNVNALALPKGAFEEMMKHNNNHFYDKGWDNGFKFGGLITLVACGTIGAAVTAVVLAHDIYKLIEEGEMKHGSKSVQKQHDDIVDDVEF